MGLLDDDRLFPADPATRSLARTLHDSVRGLPILSPHGHCDPRWFADNTAFADPARLFVTPDHYVFRMLHSQGARLEDLGVPWADGGPVATDSRTIWRRFAAQFHLFRGTPSWLWLTHAFEWVFGVDHHLTVETADHIHDHIAERLADPAYRPRALFDRFNIAALATTEAATDDLSAHAAIRDSGWAGRVITTYRPDGCTDPEAPGFADNIARLGRMTGADTTSWEGYLRAHRARRQAFKGMGATATDHGPPSTRTEDLPPRAAADLYEKVIEGHATADEADAFRGQMLTEMARMSLEDGLVMQIHPGALRNHHKVVFERFGADKGFDIPTRIDFVHALRPLLNAVGREPDLTVILFTLDESAYARELAPLAGVYPALRLGPPWWFHDSVEGMWRFRQMATETAGIYNTAGFNDDTRAFCSIPARHDVARRVDCAWLATMVTSGRLDRASAFDMAPDLAFGLAQRAYRL